MVTTTKAIAEKATKYEEARMVTGDWTDEFFPALVQTNYRWNGWAVPRFDLATAKRIVRGQAEMIETLGPDSAQSMSWVKGFRDGEPMQYIVVDNSLYDEDPTFIYPDPDGFYDIGGCEWCWYDDVEFDEDMEEEDSRIVEVPATIYIETRTTKVWGVDGSVDTIERVSDISISPLEANAGYFGERNTDEFWDRVAEYLDRTGKDESGKIRTGDLVRFDGESYVVDRFHDQNNMSLRTRNGSTIMAHRSEVDPVSDRVVLRWEG